MQPCSKTVIIRVAAVTALTGNAVLAILKISAGMISNSEALLADGMDSAMDVLISLISLVTARIIAKPADATHPWGHGRAETVATALLSFTLFFVGAQIVISSARSFIYGERGLDPSGAAIVITLISIAAKSLLAFSQHLMGKRAGSSIVRAYAKIMFGDVLLSLGVLAGLVISSLTGSSRADTVIAILIGAWIAKTAVGIFLETNLELMDGSSDISPYRVIADAVNSVGGAANPHRARMRRLAGFWDINLDIDVDPLCTAYQAHEIASQVEREIKARLDNVYDIMIHIEPRGDTSAEMFGLSEKAMLGGRENLKSIISHRQRGES